MEVDADPDIRPMSFYVESPENIEELFDNIAYSKGKSWKVSFRSDGNGWEVAIPLHFLIFLGFVVF